MPWGQLPRRPLISSATRFQLKLHSPHWGTEDAYEFNIDRQQARIMKIGSQSFAECQYVEGQSPIWSGSQPLHLTEHPLLALLEVDSIYPPHVFIAALETACRSWRNNELTDVELQAELDQLFSWVDTTTANLPQTEFWRRNL